MIWERDRGEQPLKARGGDPGGASGTDGEAGVQQVPTVGKQGASCPGAPCHNPLCGPGSGSQTPAHA